MRAFLLTLVLFLTKPALARWATQADASQNVLVENVHVYINKDYSYFTIVEREVEVLKENARSEEGLFRTEFVPTTEKFELLKAETRNGKHIISVNKKNIEIKPLASVGPGFDVKSQVTIAYPDVNIGSKIYIKYKRTIFKPSYPGAFFMSLPLGWHENLKSMVIEVVSEVPIFHEVFDADKYFKVQAEPKRLKFTLQKPLYKMVLEEEFAQYDGKSGVWVGLTSLKNWSMFPKDTIKEYEKVITSDLPPKFAKILKLAKSKSTPLEQINFVTSQLADIVRYVGDWRAVRGTYIPRTIQQVAETGYGDCKDFSAVTGAILQKMGYEAHVALINRGIDWIESPLNISALDVNHAILYLKKDKQEFWVDPTNVVSFAQGIFADIADRPAVVLHPEGAFAKRTPPMKSSDGALAIHSRAHFEPNGAIQVKGKILLSGRGALDFTAADLFNSKSVTDYNILSWVTKPGNLLQWKVGSYNLSSRIVSGFDVDFEYSEKWYPSVSSVGKGYMLKAISWVDYFRVKRDARVSNLNMAYPLSVRYTYQLTGKQVVLPSEIKCSGKSPWVDFSRRIYKGADGALQMEESMDFKVKEVSVSDIISPEFGKLQEDVIGCMQDALIVFK